MSNEYSDYLGDYRDSKIGPIPDLSLSILGSEKMRPVTEEDKHKVRKLVAMQPTSLRDRVELMRMLGLADE